ncbi:endonuclease [Tenacibaculum sp. E3R01]|uniref:YraN family protein n=1 Tax=Tenacibaculum sp. E3R01 TaxID=2267227 RepID=UPI000DE8C397|nr:YraN family protein [Tenacibaculum sp. E3R01]RBW59219.1 endonuclease [Tenacibaculum sp. E3R01]
MAAHNELGKKGEELAEDFLKNKGYTILEKNYRYQKAEVDIIAKKDNVLSVVEVKTRSTDYYGNPQDFVNPKKIKLLVAAINNYVVEKDIDIEVQFDIIAILKKNDKIVVDHIEDAFLYF